MGGLRFCDLCGMLDDHPRHVITVPDGTPEAAPTPGFLAGLAENAPVTAVALLLNGRTLIRHQDCCAAAGCQVCQATEAVHLGARGADLRESITAGTVDELETDGMQVGGE